MSIEQVKNALPDYAKDIRLNLGAVLSPDGAPGLELKHIHAIALATAYATLNPQVISALEILAAESLSHDEITAMKGAATIMAMNNIYYRFTHTMHDASYSNMPAKLRMNMMSNPGVDKITFELGSLAVSALNGCGMCMNSHASQLEKHGLTKEAVQSTVRIAAVINAAAVGLAIS